MEEKQTTVRRFANETDGGKSCGIRAMTRETGCRGLYLHGHRCEVQPPALLSSIYPPAVLETAGFMK